MARIEGTAGSLAEVDPGSLAMRMTSRPMKSLAWNGLAGMSGGLTGIAAGARIFSLRNTGTNLILIRRVTLGFMTTAAFTTAQTIDFNLFVARAFTVSDTVGTDLAPSGNMSKFRTSLATPNVASRIGIAAAVSGGTLTQDTLAVGCVAGGSTAVATGLPLTPGNLFLPAVSGLPIVLAGNEGLTVTNATLMGAAGVVKVYITVEYVEVGTADYA